LGYNLFEDDDDTLRIFELYDPKRRKKFKELLRIGFFELGKTNIETVNQKHWRDYFNTGEAGLGAPAYIKKASQIIEYVNLSEEERNVMTALERLEANDQAEREYLVMESKAIGEAMGKEKEKIEIAKSMLEDGFPPETVAKHTKLFLDYVMTIYKSVKEG